MSFTITKIEPQKRKNNRYSIFSGEQFIFGVTDQTLIEFNLHTGKKLSERQLAQIQQREEYFRLRDQALRYLARRSHSKREIKTKLLHKGFNKNDIMSLINELEQKKYIDDQHFARIFTQDEIRLKKTGPLRIRRKLLEKGVENETASGVIDSLYPESIQAENARELAEKKIKYIQDSEGIKVQRFLVNYLKQKGYTWHIIAPIIQELSGEINDYEG